jgi:organic hydroperoxide reductase OsmC/OhrA
LKQHTYKTSLAWTGNDGEGTKTYRSYRRDHTIEVAGKPPILGSSDPAFRGDPARYSPEDLLVCALSACHMLWYLHLCSTHHITVVDYHDEASGVMEERPDGSGVFTSVRLAPKVTVVAGDDHATAMALHEDAHRMCFIANSVTFPVEIAATVLDQSAVVR